MSSGEKMSSKSIPVLAVTIVRNIKWLYKLVESIDYPVDNLVIWNNNGKGELTKDLDKLAKLGPTHDYIKNINVCHFPSNLGLGGTWNMTIKCYMNAPYWVIANDDISFGPGFLQEMNEAAQDDEIGLVHGFEGSYQCGSWSLFLIKDWLVQKVGLFDENFYPLYCEDVDYLIRMRRLEVDGEGVQRILNLDSTYYHGDKPGKPPRFEPEETQKIDKTAPIWKDLEDYYRDGGQQTTKGDEELQNKFWAVHHTNWEYMDEKWGKEWKHEWCFGRPDLAAPVYYAPFGNYQIPIDYVKYDLKFNRSKHLGF